jgi:hypothetical protein
MRERFPAQLPQIPLRVRVRLQQQPHTRWPEQYVGLSAVHAPATPRPGPVPLPRSRPPACDRRVGPIRRRRCGAGHRGTHPAAGRHQPGMSKPQWRCRSSPPSSTPPPRENSPRPSSPSSTRFTGLSIGITSALLRAPDAHGQRGLPGGAQGHQPAQSRRHRQQESHGPRAIAKLVHTHWSTMRHSRIKVRQSLCRRGAPQREAPLLTSTSMTCAEAVGFEPT